MKRQNILRLSMLQMVFLSAMTMAATAEAKEGFFLGAEMVFADIGGAVNSGDAISAGDGNGITAGYGISRNIAIEASYRSTVHQVSGGGKVDLTAALIGVKASLQLTKSHMEPYVVLGVGHYALDARRGNGWHYGAGIEIGLAPAFSLTMGIAHHTFDLDPAPRESGTASSMDIGIVYHFL